VTAARRIGAIDAAGFARMVGDKPDELPAYYPAAVEFFNVYEAALRDAGAIDFADMVPLLTRAMAHDTAIRSAITGAFDHMLVDEYQDVNPGQLDQALLHAADQVDDVDLLVPPHPASVKDMPLPRHIPQLELFRETEALGLASQMPEGEGVKGVDRQSLRPA
jgi:hypothetical protein